MPIVVEVKSKEDFAKWLSEQKGENLAGDVSVQTLAKTDNIWGRKWVILQPLDHEHHDHKPKGFVKQMVNDNKP